jgi:hypothetical protein
VSSSAEWLAMRGLEGGDEPWQVVIELEDSDRADTRLIVAIEPAGWSYQFAHGGQRSSIQVTDGPRVYERDDFGLCAETPSLANLGALVRGLEIRFDVWFRRLRAPVRTNLAGAEPNIRQWIVAKL